MHAQGSEGAAAVSKCRALVRQRRFRAPNAQRPLPPPPPQIQALQLPAAALPSTMAADNLAMGALLAALITCPPRLVRRITAPEATAAAKERLAAQRARQMAAAAADAVGGGLRSPGGAGSASNGGGGSLAAQVTASLQRQVTVPASMSGQPVGKDGTLLLTEEPAASAVWAAYQRSKDAASAGGSPAGGSPPGSPARRAAAAANGDAATPSAAAAPPEFAPILPPELSEGGPLGSFDSGPLARDGGPLLTAEPSPITLQAAYARSRDPSFDSGDEGANDVISIGREGGRNARLTVRSAAAALAGAAGVCWASGAAVEALGEPHLYLLAVSALSLAMSAAGGWRGRALFGGAQGCWAAGAGGQGLARGRPRGALTCSAAANRLARRQPEGACPCPAPIIPHPNHHHTPCKPGASKLGAPLMGCFFVTIGATSSAAGVSLGQLAPMLAFIATMVAVHWAVVLAGARALRLEPSVALVRGGL